MVPDKQCMAASLFSVVPVELYKLAISLQSELTAGLTGSASSVGDLATEVITTFQGAGTTIAEVQSSDVLTGMEIATSPILLIFVIILMIQENPYLQYFCGYPGYDDEHLPFDPSTMVYFRKRLTPEILGEINEMILKTVESEKHGTSVPLLSCNPCGNFSFPLDKSSESKGRCGCCGRHLPCAARGV